MVLGKFSIGVAFFNAKLYFVYVSIEKKRRVRKFMQNEINRERKLTYERITHKDQSNE